jgi:hypothetical protein
MIGPTQAAGVEFIVKTPRRQFVKLLSILPLVGSFALFRTSLAEKQLDNNHVIVNGWILKKSDLVDYLG